MFRTTIIAALAAFAVGGAAYAQNQMAPVAQTTGIKRIPLQKFDVPPGERETVTAIAEIAPNTDVARHSDLTLTIEGQPPRAMKAGDSSYIPGEHTACRA
jgi:hypothetical protein